MTKAGMSAQAIWRPRTRGASARVAAEIVTPWRLALAMVGINVVLALWCLVLGAGVTAAVCAMCAGWTGSTCWVGRALR